MIPEERHERNRVPVRLPENKVSPFGSIGRRVGFALFLIAFVALVAYADRGGYQDNGGGGLSLLDAFYYSTVTITTTGYGDIYPASEASRLLTTILITPARILFLILLVGTTLEFLAERTREAYRLRRWRADLEDHMIICGYGTKGRSAVSSLEGHEIDRSKILIVDPDETALEGARASGFATIHGDATRTEVLRTAGVESARGVVVAANRDDAAVLITLTARELNKTATIVSAVREEENGHLLRQSGADSVISSSSAAGRLLGLATQTPRVVDVLEDLLSVGEGLDIVEHDVGEKDTGKPLAEFEPGMLKVAIIRGEEILRFDDSRVRELEAGDRVVCLCNRDAA